MTNFLVYSQQHENGLWVHISTCLKYALPPCICQEAQSICNGIYRMNAKGAIGYAFNFTKGKSSKGITNGEFVYKFDGLIDQYDFVYLFKEKDYYSPLWSSYKSMIGIDALDKKDAIKYNVTNKS